MFGRKRKKSKGSALRFLVVPVAVLFALLLTFFVFDEFWLYYFVMNQDNSTAGYDGGQSPVYDGKISNYYKQESAIGSTGTTLMATNATSGSYVKDYLTILLNHLNWTYMSSSVSCPTVNGQKLLPNLSMGLGFSLAETGIGSNFLPRTVLDPAKYGSHSGEYNFYTANSNCFAEWGESEMFIMCAFDLSYSDVAGKRPSTGKTYVSQLQINRSYMSVYPTGTTGTGTMIPSKLNGRGFSSDAVRTKAQSDAAYLPDQFSAMLQIGWSSLGSYIDLNTVTPDALGNICYSFYNGGPGIIYNTWSIGDTPTPSNRLSSNDGATRKRMASQVVMDISNQIEIVYNYLLQHPPASNEFYYTNHPDYEGLSVMMMLLKGDGFFTSETALNQFKRSYTGSVGIQRGALIAYRVAMNKPTATKADVDAFIATLTPHPLSDDYWPNYTGKNSSEYTISYYDKTERVQYKSGGQVVPVLHTINAESVRGCYMTKIGSAYVYPKMLAAAGVECTSAQAAADLATGSLIAKIPDANRGGPSNKDLQTAAVSYAYPTRVMAENEFTQLWIAHGSHKTAKGGKEPYGVVCGTDLYKAVHEKVTAYGGREDQYWASCDRGVACAVRWAGYDDNFPLGNVGTQLNYCVRSEKWKEITWSGQQSELQPGDILITKTLSHIVMYVGNDTVVEIYPTQATRGACIMDASFGDRPPCLKVWYSSLSNCRVFRNVKKETNSKYISVLADTLT